MRQAAFEIVPENPFADGEAAGREEGRAGARAEISRLLKGPFLKATLGAMSRAELGRQVMARLETPPDTGRFPELGELHPDRVDVVRGFARGAGCSLQEAAVLSYLRFRARTAAYYEPLHDLSSDPSERRDGCSGVLLVGNDGVLGAHSIESTALTPRPRGYRDRRPPPHARWSARKPAAARDLVVRKPRSGYIANWGVANEKGVGCFAAVSCSTWLDEPIEDTWPLDQVPLLRFADSLEHLIALYRRYTLHNWGRASQIWADASGDGCVIEKTFRRIAVRRLTGSVLWCTEGHFESPEMHAFIRAKRMEYVEKSGKHAGCGDLQYADDCAVRFRHIGELCHEPLGRGYRHMNRILTDHAPFPRAVCRHCGPDTDAYDRTMTQISLFSDATHNRRFSREWIPWKRFPCEAPWTVTQYPARPA